MKRFFLLHGTIQGVGLRPALYRQAQAYQLDGWTRNTASTVELLIEGPPSAVDAFLAGLPAALPHAASLSSMRETAPPIDVPPPAKPFAILPSPTGSRAAAVIPPDLAPCADCLRELFDPGSRRFRYPFINCTACGPRYSILQCLPYDRPHTSMATFELCPECQREYEDPGNRRFHAQPNACPRCGPALAFYDREGKRLSERADALADAEALLRAGGILALKGLGGYQLLCDARSSEVVTTLRQRKRRAHKPFAVMVTDTDVARCLAVFSATEMDALSSPSAPIVLVYATGQQQVSPLVAPGNPLLGLLLPATPLHHLIARDTGFPLVTTSGNLSDEPLCTNDKDAFQRLGSIADGFLSHDRPIVRAIDDSVVRVIADQPVVLRHARGYAPYRLGLPSVEKPVLAVGGFLKSALAYITPGGRENLTLGPHIGDLSTPLAREHFSRQAELLNRLHQDAPAAIACDAHPDYPSTHYAERSGLPVRKVQHHHAHALALQAEHQSWGEPLFAVVFDGTGYGADGSLWGGEFLQIHGSQWKRVARLRPFPLPGAENAIHDPRRIALSLLSQSGLSGPEQKAWLQRLEIPPQQHELLRKMLAHPESQPTTSAAGRLFDGVAALLGLVGESEYEAHAACALEYAALDYLGTSPAPEAFPYALNDGELLEMDWRPLLRALVQGVDEGQSVPLLAARFHLTLADSIAAIAKRLGASRVGLTGGCFANAVLAEHARELLRNNGHEVLLHSRVPPGDGGICVGQALAFVLDEPGPE